jgi:Ca2+-binding EF-hand superfamily protein
MISYLELKDILGKYQIDINKELVVLLLKYMNIENPNCFYLKEFIDKVNNQMMNSTCFDFRKSYNTDKNNTLSNYRFKNNMKISYNDTYNSNSLNSDLNNKDHITNIKTKILQNSNNNLNEDTKINNEEFSHLLITKLIKDIKDRIFRKNSKIDNISLYFDKLLSYNICRSENVINLEELVRLFQLEQFKFTNQEIKAIFDFMDTKKDGVIDRIEFINAIRNIPHPLSNFINYMKNNGITIADIAYKIGYDIYNNPVNECLNSKLNKLSFQTKLKALNEHFDNEFIYGLFNYISEGKTEIKVKQFFDMINYNNDESYKNLFEIKDEIINTCMDIIPKNVSYTELKDNIMKHDKQLKGEITSVDFISIMRKFLGQKIQQQNLFDFLRIYKLINNKNIINYQKFLMIIYKDCKDDLWMKSLAAFHHFLKKECNDDLFIFIVKINNLSNNISIKRTVESDRMQRFIRDRIGREVDLNTIMKFDFNGDGIISMDDLKNIVLKYIDKNYFETKEVREENLKQNEMKKNKAKNKELFLELKKILNKSNMTEDNLFFYLDKNQDNILDFDEFKTQLPLLLNKSINNQDLIIFFDYLDEYKIKQVDINTFRAKLRLFNDEIKNNHEDDYIGNSTIENLLLDEFSKWLKKNSNLCDTELFPILDHDHDGIITLKDIKFFANKILFMPLNELNDTKILHFIVALSITNSNYLVLADVQNIMKNIKLKKLIFIRSEAN